MLKALMFDTWFSLSSTFTMALTHTIKLGVARFDLRDPGGIDFL
jgi:hypothetical protein